MLVLHDNPPFTGGRSDEGNLFCPHVTLNTVSQANSTIGPHSTSIDGTDRIKNLECKQGLMPSIRSDIKIVPSSGSIVL